MMVRYGEMGDSVPADLSAISHTHPFLHFDQNNVVPNMDYPGGRMPRTMGTWMENVRLRRAMGGFR